MASETAIRVSYLECQGRKGRTDPNPARLLVNVVSLIQLFSYSGEIGFDFFGSPWSWFTELDCVSNR